MTDIKEPINTTSDGTFPSVVCENPEKSVVGRKLGGCGPPAPPGITPLIKRGSSALPSPSFRSNTEGGLKSFYYTALKLQNYLLIFFFAWTYIDCSTKMFYNLSAVYSGKKNSPNCPLYGFLKV